MASTPTEDLTYVSFPIVKFEKTEDGDLVVYGKATDGSVDSDEQVVEPGWSAKALQDWHASGGNVRVQHQALRDPAGRSMSIDIDKDGDTGHWVKSLVVEPVAKRLVEKGVLTAYSVGIARPVIKRDPTGKARGGIVAGGHLAEISLVDRPANKSCGLVLAKSAGGTEVMELVSETGELFGEPDMLAKYATDTDLLTKSDDTTDAEDPDLAKAGATPPAGDAAPAAAGSQQSQAAGDDGDDGDDGDGGDDDTDDDDDSDGDDPVSKADDDTRRTYRAERKAWLAREPAVAKAVGGTEYLQARSEWQRWNAEGEQSGLTGTRDGAMLWLAKRGQEPAQIAETTDLDEAYKAAEADVFKRDVDAAERRQLASAGHALPDGSYPIKNASDLENAATLARSGHGNVAAARRLIARRAKELGVDNPLSADDKIKKETAAEDGAVAQADTLKAGDDTAKAATPPASDDDDAPAGKPCPTCKGDGKIMGNQRKCPDCDGTGKMPMGKDSEPDLAKDGRDCTGCGANYHADHKGNFCSSCGRKLPAATKADDGALPDAVLALAETVAKSVEAGILTREAGDELITAAVEKTTRGLPADTRDAGDHREPDGTSTVERLEPQAGLATDPDPTADKVPASVAGLGTGARPASGTGPSRKGEVTYEVARMHDVSCAAYHNEVIKGEYPSLGSFADAYRLGWFTSTAAEYAMAGKSKKSARWSAAADQAVVLKDLDPAAVEDGRAQLHKSFSDMYPSEKISPSMAPKPGSYQRPYLSAGHAAENAGRNGSANIPRSAHTPEPEDFNRPLITAGHEASSPGTDNQSKAADPNLPDGMGDIRNHGQVRTGASRTYYTNAQREAARVAMQSIHDHITQNFPDMCPMASSKSVMPPDMGANNVPEVRTPAVPGGVPGVGKATVGTIPVTIDTGAVNTMALQQQIADAIRRHTARVAPPSLTRKQLAKAAATLGYDLIEQPEVTRRSPSADTQVMAGLTADEMKALLSEYVTPLTERYEQQIADLQKQVDDIGAQPDPALAPVRGALAKAVTASAVPVERRSLVDEAANKARERAAEEARYRAYIDHLTESPDPQTRERALSVLTKLAGEPQ